VGIILPALNEASTVADCIRSVHGGWPKAEIVVVVGGDSATETAARRVAAELRDVTVIRQNAHGKGAAVREGLKMMQAPVIAQFDTDGQFPVAELERVIDAVRQNHADLCVGSRFMGRDRGSTTAGGWPRRAGNRLLSAWVSLLTGHVCTDVTSGLKAWRRDLTERHPLSDSGYCYELEIIIRTLRAGYRHQEVPVAEEPRKGGRSMHRGWGGLLRAGVRLFFSALRYRFD